MPKPAERTALYRLYDKHGRLLYIGITNNPEARWKRHAMFQPWWGEVARKEIAWVKTWGAATCAEEAAIRNESPWYNGTHNYPLTPFDPSDWPSASTAPSKVEAVAQLIRERIDSGEWLHGHRIPNAGELSAATDVSKTTAVRALRLLQAESRLIYLPGFGVFVSDGTEIKRPNRAGRR